MQEAIIVFHVQIDAMLVNSLRAGMRTLKNMPDQFANTVDGVMDGKRGNLNVHLQGHQHIKFDVLILNSTLCGFE